MASASVCCTSGSAKGSNSTRKWLSERMNSVIFARDLPSTRALTVPSGRRSNWRTVPTAPHSVQVFFLRVVHGGVFLGDQENAFVLGHGFGQGVYGLVPAHEQGHHHMGETRLCPSGANRGRFMRGTPSSSWLFLSLDMLNIKFYFRQFYQAFFLLGSKRRMGSSAVHDHLFPYDAFLDVFHGRNLVLDIQHGLFHDSAQAPGA